MADEIELKLSLPEAAQALFLRQGLLREAAARQRKALLNIYYDTPDQALRRRGIALRLRRQDGGWLQTVKCAGESGAGLSTRPEWETPYGGRFDFSPVDDGKIRKWLEQASIRDRLRPVFETAFRRIIWRFPVPDGGAILLMLDRGRIAAAGRRESLSEVEIELAGATVSDLFALARRLAEKVPLAPALLSKADRGYRLADGENLSPQKAIDVSLEADDRPLDAFRAIALACLEQIAANHAGALVRDDPEFIHQMRVATRRLRACLRLFSPLLPEAFPATVLPALRELMALLGRARDYDVLLAEIVQPVIAALPAEPRLAALAGIIVDRRHEARGAALHALQTPRYGSLMLAIAAELQPDPPTAPGADGGVASFAAERLRRLGKKVHRLAAAARCDDPTSLHALRIGIKRLRYALEFFVPLAPAGIDRCLRHLSGAQETLGQLNDLASAGRMLMDCIGEDLRLREAVTLIGGWHGPHHGRLHAGLPKLLARLRKLKLPKVS